MNFELVETLNDEYWKARVYWVTKSKAIYSDIDYFEHQVERTRTIDELKLWCQQQEGDSMMIPNMNKTAGMAFEHVADAVAFALVWSTKLGALQWG
jgi:hypothetical protein